MSTDTNTNIYAGQIASPPTIFDSGEFGGRVRAVIGTVAIIATDLAADGDRVNLCSLPGGARITSIKLLNTALSAAASDCDIGIWAHQGAVIDENEFADNVTAFNAAVEVPTEYLGAGIAGGDVNLETTLWERAGASTDTGVLYDIVIAQTATATTPATGTLEFIIEYTIT